MGIDYLQQRDQNDFSRSIKLCLGCAPGAVVTIVAAFLLALAAIDLAAPPGSCIEPNYSMQFGEPPRPIRVINFPADYSIGAVKMVPAMLRSRGRVLEAVAQGKVVVPAGYCSYFQAGHRFFANPAIVKTLSPDAFDSIQLTALSLDDSEDDEVDRALAVIGHLTGLRQVLLERSDASDTGVAHLAELPHVQHISLFATICTGRCLKQLATMKTLTSLSLSHSSIEPSNFKYLTNMHQLRELTASYCQLTDQGLSYISQCKSLRALNISANARLTDESLKYLLPLKNLRHLSLDDTDCSLKGLLQLKGLPLTALVTPGKPYTGKDLALLRRTFPDLQQLQTTHRRTMDAEDSTLYAPLH